MAKQKHSDNIIIDLPQVGKVPVKVIREKRNNLRASIGKSSLLFRLPKQSNTHQERKHWDWFMTWARKVSSKNNGQQLVHLVPKSYPDKSEIQVGDRLYQLRLIPKNRKTIGAHLNGKTISIDFPENLQSPEREATIKKALSRVVAADFLPAIAERVHLLNDAYFSQPLGQVRLKYNHSNWGSCSNRGNINLSTRLLFAPQQVIDYVIIHELAHRIEFNHSPRFWHLVERALPHYQMAEKWLRDHYHECDF